MDKMPVYVKLPEPASLKHVIEEVRQAIAKTRKSLDTIKSLSEEESAKVKQWKDSFKSVDAKMQQIKDTLLDPEGV